jgi:hypothetical protein
MDRRQIEDVEPHRRDVGQPRRRFVERRAPRRIGSRRAREHFVPRAEPRALALGNHGEDSSIARRRAAPAVLGQQRLLEPLAGDVLAGGELLLEAVLPGAARIHPAFHGELVGGELDRRRERRAPAIVRQRVHRRLLPGGLPLPPPQQHRREHIMPVRVDVRLDDDLFADRPLRRISSFVHLRRHAFNDHAPQECRIE